MPLAGLRESGRSTSSVDGRLASISVLRGGEKAGLFELSVISVDEWVQAQDPGYVWRSALDMTLEYMAEETGRSIRDLASTLPRWELPQTYSRTVLVDGADQQVICFRVGAAIEVIQPERRDLGFCVVARVPLEDLPHADTALESTLDEEKAEP